MFDVVLGGEEFVDMAEKLGYSTLIFASPDGEFATSSGNIKHALLITSSKKDDVVRAVARAQREKILTIVRAHDDDFNRFVVEKTAADFLLDPEHFHKTDHLHFRRSGLDQVLCAAAAKNKKTILSSLPSNSIILGRMVQNMMLCKKYGVDYQIVSLAQHPLEMKGAHDVKALMKTLSG